MVKIIIEKVIMLLCIISILGCHQEVVEKYSNGNTKSIYYKRIIPPRIINGPYKKFYENGAIQEDGTLINNSQEGRQKLYFVDGKIAEVRLFNNGKRNGYDSVWYENQQLKIVRNFDNDQLHGNSIEWYKNGTIKCKYNFVKGKINGEAFEFDSSGNIKEKLNFKDNLLSGKRELYYSTGSIKSENYYIENKLNGRQVEYFPNGNVRLTHKLFQNYIPCDTMFFYDSLTGVLAAKVIYTLDCDSLSIIPNEDIPGITYKYDKKNGKTLKKKAFILEYDSLEQYDNVRAMKYIVSKFTF